ncbi:MAG TPA: Uma2 family endonuclease [Chthoniobacterales bacterium]
MDSLLEPLLKSPRLPELARSLAQVVAEEEIRRQKFIDDLTDEVKAEFIDGDVIMHSPVRAQHLRVTKNISFLLTWHVTMQEAGEVFTEKCLVSLTRNDYEPDILYFGPEKSATFTPGKTRFPAPDLVVEVLSDSTEGRDRGVKFEDYAAHGVREYWIVDADREWVEQYVLPNDGKAFVLKEKLTHGTLLCEVLPGFEPPVLAFFDEAELRKQLSPAA